MEFYFTLTAVTGIIIFFSWKIWKKTRDVSFVAGIFLIYYWTLLGAWFIVYDELTGQKGKEFGLHYYYLLDKMFPVHADHFYMKAILFYSLFIVSLQLTILRFTRTKSRVEEAQVRGEQKIILRNNLLFLVSSVSIVFSFVLMFPEFKTAFELNKSFYTVSTTSGSRFYSFHQIFNLIAICPLLIGFVTLLGGQKNNFLFTVRSKFTFLFYFLLILFVEFYMIVLGSKHTLFFAGLSGFLFYLYNVKYHIRLKPFLIFAFLVGIPLVVMDTIRSYPLVTLLNRIGFDFHGSGLGELPIDPTPFSLRRVINNFVFSNELFCAHFSMYGALSFNLPFTWGSSIVSLLASIVPRIFWADRPAQIYDYYVNSVHAVAGQGYTINHATAWYLNFGIAGIIAGAFLLGWLWTFFYNKFQTGNFEKIRNRYFKLIIILAVPGITAQIMNLIRSGPEGYKALLFEAILIPAAVLFAVTRYSSKE